MDRRRQEDSRDRRRDDYKDDYRGRSRYGRDDRTRNRSRSRSASRDGNRIRRSRSPRRDYHDDDRRSYNRTSNYRDLDRPEAIKEKKDVEMKESPRKEASKPSEPVATDAEELLDEDAQIAALLGINSFASTKGQKVSGNSANFAVDVPASKKKREYRQYLFVKGAYDIPLTKDQLEAKEKEQQARNHQHQ